MCRRPLCAGRWVLGAAYVPRGGGGGGGGGGEEGGREEVDVLCAFYASMGENLICMSMNERKNERRCMYCTVA